jgi:hypothetical protein
MTMRSRALLLLLAATLSGRAHAGVNAGFTIELGVGERIENPQIGQVLSIPVFFRQLTEVRGLAASFRYDTTYLSFAGFEAGTLLPEAVGFPGEPIIGDDGIATIDAGLTLLGRDTTIRTPGGLFGTFRFVLDSELPDGGSPIVLSQAEANTSGDPTTADRLGPDIARVQLIPVFPNGIFNVVVERKHNGAAIAWNTRFVGIEDVLRLRRAGSQDEFLVFANPINQRFSQRVFEGNRGLRERGINFPALPDQEVAVALRGILDLDAVPDEEVLRIVRRIRELDNVLQSRTHVVPIPELPPQTEFEFEIVSRSLDGRRSPTHRGRFSTRLEPDLRPLFVSQFDLQATSTGAIASFGTNRPTTSSYVLRRLPEGTVVEADTLNEDGEQRTRLAFEDLEPGIEYDLQVTATLIDAQTLIDAGLPADASSRTVGKRFRTRAERRRLVMIRPPVKIVGSDRANIVFEANQPVDAFVDYGLVGDVERVTSATSDDLYDWQQESTATLRLHNLTLSNLDASTLFRYKITLVNAEGDTFTTDPIGNFQHSRDLRFRTAAAADTLPPEVILGPVVDIRDVLAVVRFATDVPTAATIYVGTETTYNTEDEYEFADLTPDGETRYANRHSIIVSGLDAGETYRYRLEVEATNGQVTTLEPSIGSGKAVGLRQPPGGSGSFTTSNDPDTQWPVILSGPTVSSKSNSTAIVEWTTDEPADSEVAFGIESIGDDAETSAVTETSHKITLSNLTAGTTYSYQVGSTDASGNGATQSSQAVFTTDAETDLTAPTITATPSVTYKNNESATIEWSTDEDATGEVSFGTSEDDLGFIRTLPDTDEDHSVTLTNLSESTTYFYQVSSSDLSNNGPTTSAVLSFTTDAAPDLTAPTISDIEVAESDSSVIITWTTDEAADSYVDFGTVSGILDLTVGDVEDVTAHEITLTNLTPGQTYFYTVGSIDRSNNGPTESAEGSFTTLSSADVTAPSTPANLSGTAGSEQTILTWTANTELDLGGYNVYRKAASASAFTAIASRLSGTSYTDPGLTNDTEYEYQITAIDRETPPNESDPTTTLALPPTLSAAPTTPAGLTVEGEALTPTFTFTNAEPFNSGATLTYTIQLSTESDFSNVTDSQSDVAQGSGTTSWTTTRTLTDGLTYYWRVRAVEGSLTGPFTDTQTFTVEAPAALPGDFDDSGAVDFDDFFAFVDAFGQSADDFPAFDLDGSGSGTSIDFDDFFAFVDAFGTSAGKSAGAWAFAHRLDEETRLRLVAEGGPVSGGALPRDIVRLRVVADEARDIDAYGLVLAYDPAAVTFVSADEGPGALLGSRGGDALFRVLDDRPGRLLIGNGLVEGKPVSGSGLLAQLTFRLRDRQRANDVRFDVQQAFLARGTEDVRRVRAVESSYLRPTAFSLGQAYPNPFNPSTQIDFTLPQESPARLVVYDVLGRTVRTLVRADEALPAGFYSINWDGRDQEGRPVGNGLYLYRLTAGRDTQTGKMMLLK